MNVSPGTTRLAPPGVGGYAAVNLLAAVMRKELAGEDIAVALVVPSVTATEFAGGRFPRGGPVPSGMVPHSAGYVGRIILRALRSGEARIDIPHGPEQAGPAGLTAG